MTHAIGCTMPTPTTDSSGQPRCPSCKYVQAKPKASAATGYVCRDHHDQPVTWRGTGCPRCAGDLKARTAPKVREDYDRLTYR